jgi:hypothetical protein
MIFLHHAKAQRSYFGGRIDAYKQVDTQNAHKRRIVFTFTFTPEGKGSAWYGADHPPRGPVALSTDHRSELTA